MDQDYLRALLGDIEKTSLIEEKISLLVIGFTELAEHNQKQTELMNATAKTLRSAETVTKGLLKGMGLLQERYNEVVEAITTSAQSIARTTEGAASSAESINKIYETLIPMQETIYKLEDGLRLVNKSYK